MAELLRRLRGAWRVLRHGAPADPRRLEVTVEELRTLVERALGVAGLPPRWAHDASSIELEVVADALHFALEVRRVEWARLQAGEWPATPEVAR